MVELVVVLVLIGIVVVVGGQKFFDLQSYRRRVWIDQLQVTTSYARAQAIANRSQKVRLVLDASSLRAELATDCSTASATALANTAGNGNLAFTAPGGVTLAVAGQSLPFTVCFDSQGRPRDNSSPAGSFLTSITTLQITASGSTTPLYLEPQTGFIHP
jgi:Tfp pilus assembly protein FimT